MTEELKALLKAAKTEEEAKEILLAHKSELTDEDLEKISGGTVIICTIGSIIWMTISTATDADCLP